MITPRIGFMEGVNTVLAIACSACITIRVFKNDNATSCLVAALYRGRQAREQRVLPLTVVER